jgi:NADH-quinone oxidoreductase subunit F
MIRCSSEVPLQVVKPRESESQTSDRTGQNSSLASFLFRDSIDITNRDGTSTSELEERGLLVNEEFAHIDLQPLNRLAEAYRDRGRDALLPFLQDAQSIYGWLPEDTQRIISETLRVPLADIHGVIEFYTMLYNRPTSKKVIRVCHDPVCHLAGSDAVLEKINERVRLTGRQAQQTATKVEKVSCLGMCEHAPVALFGEEAVGDLTPAAVVDLLSMDVPAQPSRVYGDRLLLLERVDKVDPSSLDAYLASDGYVALHKVVNSEPSQVIELVNQTGILGRGGAMFPVGRKWIFTREAASVTGERYILVNGDESEPGAFKDRVIMEGDPFAIIEAATIGGYAIGAKKGWIFVRGEYPLAYKRLANAVAKAREGGYLGSNILGVQGFDFDIELRRGAGAYICGEETALFEAIEGKRGFPRKKPPFPVTHGLHQKPTAVNNVETLAALLAAIRIGVEKWREIGTEQSPGTKLFCMSGHVVRPGVYEMPFGITIKDMIEKAGGVPNGRAIKAILVGGAAGVFIGPDKLEMQLTYEASRQHGVPLGSGALMVFDDSVDLRHVVFQISRFFAHESCGKCFPCQLGTQRQMEILERGALSDRLVMEDMVALEDIGLAMTQTSLCGLGQTAASATLSALELWPDLYKRAEES